MHRNPCRWYLAGLMFGLTWAAAANAQLAAGPGLPRADAKAAGLSPEKLAKIDELLKTAVEQKTIAGGAALVARGGKVVHLAVAGKQDIEGQTPVSDRTIFRIASMTKPITSVATMPTPLPLLPPVHYLAAKYVGSGQNVNLLADILVECE